MCCGAATAVEAADIVTPSRVFSRVFRGPSWALPNTTEAGFERNELLFRSGGLLPRGASGVGGKLSERGGGRQLPAPLYRPSRPLSATFSWLPIPCPEMDKEKLPIAGEADGSTGPALAGAGELGEVRDDAGEDLKRPVELIALMGRHHAGAKERAAGRDRGV